MRRPLRDCLTEEGRREIAALLDLHGILPVLDELRAQTRVQALGAAERAKVASGWKVDREKHDLAVHAFRLTRLEGFLTEALEVFGAPIER